MHKTISSNAFPINCLDSMDKRLHTSALKTTYSLTPNVGKRRGRKDGWVEGRMERHKKVTEMVSGKLRLEWGFEMMTHDVIDC